MNSLPELMIHARDLKRHTEHLSNHDMGVYMRRVLSTYKVGLLHPDDPRESDPLPATEEQP